MSEHETTRTLVRGLLEAYRPWVLRRLDDQGIRLPPGLDEALAEGEAWLEETLVELLPRSFADQPRGPLEVFREAMRFPTAVLAEAGAEPVRRDPAARRALPWDRYDLAPASSSELGEEVWRTHLAWGQAKAEAVAPLVTAESPLPDPAPAGGGRESSAAGPPERRVIGLLTRDLMDRSKVEEAVRAAGLTLVVWAGEEDIDQAVAVALVDLRHPDADQAISRLGGAEAPIYAYGPHVDDWALRRARSLGAADALPRSRFFRRLPELLPIVT